MGRSLTPDACSMWNAPASTPHALSAATIAHAGMMFVALGFVAPVSAILAILRLPRDAQATLGTSLVEADVSDANCIRLVLKLSSHQFCCHSVFRSLIPHSPAGQASLGQRASGVPVRGAVLDHHRVHGGPADAVWAAVCLCSRRAGPVYPGGAVLPVCSCHGAGQHQVLPTPQGAVGYVGPGEIVQIYRKPVLCVLRDLLQGLRVTYVVSGCLIFILAMAAMLTGFDDASVTVSGGSPVQRAML